MGIGSVLASPCLSPAPSGWPWLVDGEARDRVQVVVIRREHGDAEALHDRDGQGVIGQQPVVL